MFKNPLRSLINGLDPRVKKRMRKMLFFVAILFGCIFVYKAFIGFVIKRAINANLSPIITVSAMKAEYSPWQPQLSASGSSRAVRGVNVTTELASLVAAIYLT